MPLFWSGIATLDFAEHYAPQVAISSVEVTIAKRNST